MPGLLVERSLTESLGNGLQKWASDNTRLQRRGPSRTCTGFPVRRPFSEKMTDHQRNNTAYYTESAFFVNRCFVMFFLSFASGDYDMWPKTLKCNVFLSLSVLSHHAFSEGLQVIMMKSRIRKTFGMFVATSSTTIAAIVFTFVTLAADYNNVARADDAMTVNVMTFNIRCSSAHDGVDRWPNRRAAAIEFIRGQKADFVDIQEALPDQAADLQKLLPEYQQLIRSREADPTRGEAGPILYRHERWQLDKEQQGWFWLSDTPEKPGSNTWGAACVRIATWARFIDRTTNRGVYVFNTHLDHISENARQKAALLIAQRIAARKLPEPVVVTGDFNAGETSAVVGILIGKTPGSPVKLVDTFRAVHPDAKEVGTFHAFRGGVTGDKIDYILASPGVKVVAAEIHHDNRNGRYPSDHFPVTAAIVFPPKTPSPTSVHP